MNNVYREGDYNHIYISIKSNVTFYELNIFVLVLNIFIFNIFTFNVFDDF